MEKLPRLDIIIPCFNEERVIARTIDSVREVFPEANIIVVNDGSTDDTDLVLRYGEDKDITYYSKSHQQGKGWALKSGFKLTTYSDYVAFLDADLQIEPSELLTFMNVLKLYNADGVIGNKSHQYSNVQYSFIRRLVSKLYHALIKFLFGIPLNDTQCGLKIFKRDKIAPIMDRLLAKRFAFDLELLVALRVNNVRIADAPVYVKPSTDRGSVSWSSIVLTLIDTLAIKYRQMKGWYNQ